MSKRDRGPDTQLGSTHLRHALLGQVSTGQGLAIAIAIASLVDAEVTTEVI